MSAEDDSGASRGQARAHVLIVLRALDAEARKLRSLPPWWCIAAGLVAAGVVLAIAFATAWRDGGFEADTIVEIALRGMAYLQPGFVVLGIVVSSSEYADGQASATFRAVPRRLVVVAAKAIVTAAHGLPVVLAVVAAALAVVLVIVWPDAPGFGTAGSAGSVAGAVLDATASVVAGVALGLLTRSALLAAAIATVYLAAIAPALREALAWTLWLPATPGYRLAYPELFAAQGPAWAAIAWIVAWLAAGLGAAFVVVRWRDA